MILATIIAALGTFSTQVIVPKPTTTNAVKKVVINYTYKPDKTLPNWRVHEQRFVRQFQTNVITVVKEVK